jgi:hypothetical protein
MTRPQARSTEADGHSARPITGFWLVFVSVAVGLISFLATEIMHSLLVAEIGRTWERILAESVSSVLVTLLTARLIVEMNQRRKAALLRMQVISEMNHHIRNALAAICLSTDAIHNQQCIRVISESVDRIEWALREVLPRSKPLEGKPARRYFLWPRREPSPPAGRTLP